MAYAAGDTLVRAVMTAYSGLPKDQVSNDFAFAHTGTPSGSDYDAVMAAVDGWYRDTQTIGTKVGEHISSFVSRSATHELQCYKIVVGDLGSPVRTMDWLGPPTPSAASGLPSEVAAVLSMNASLTGIAEESGATRPRARRRGRVYLGPLIGGSATTVTSTPPYLLADNLLTVLRQATIAMATEALAAGWTLSVWSRADQLLRPVVAGWTDNAPDTQRRRGASSTARVVYTI